jgi:lipopolysaccharide export LptBFGC system permease protein LptF
MQRLIDPAISDLQIEYEAARGHWLRRFWIWTAGHIALGKMLLMHGGVRSVEMIADTTGDERRSLARTTVWIIGAILIVTVLLEAASLRAEFARNTEDPLTLVLLRVPQALLISIPVGLVVAILQAQRHGPVTRVSGTLILIIAAVLSIGSFALASWLIPETNQTYRELVFRRLLADSAGALYAGERTLPRGAAELTMSQLRAAIAEERAQGIHTRPRNRPALAAQAEFSYHMRWALSFTPIVVALFAVVVVTRLTRSRIVRWLVACGVVAGYCAVYFVTGDGASGFSRTMPMVMAWTPNVALLVITGAIAKHVRSGAPVADSVP